MYRSSLLALMKVSKLSLQKLLKVGNGFSQKMMELKCSRASMICSPKYDPYFFITILTVYRENMDTIIHKFQLTFSKW